MAESQPFANAGLSMFGQDAAIAKQMSTPESFQEKAAKAATAGASPLAILANKAFESLASAFPDSSKTISDIQGAIVPTGQASPVAPVAPATTSAPVIGVPPVTSQPTDATTDPNSTYSFGGYRKFLRPSGFGATTQ